MHLVLHLRQLSRVAGNLHLGEPIEPLKVRETGRIF
jgi:hypothetical protein